VLDRHCEECSDEAILCVTAGTQDCRALRARNDIFRRPHNDNLHFHITNVIMHCNITSVV
jgi:hypothetical protein